MYMAFGKGTERLDPREPQQKPSASDTGFWRMSGHPAVQQALRNPYFDGLGLPRLYIPAHA